MIPTDTTSCHFAARTPSPAFGGLHVAARRTARPHLCMQPPERCTPRLSLSVSATAGTNPSVRPGKGRR